MRLALSGLAFAFACVAGSSRESATAKPAESLESAEPAEPAEPVASESALPAPAPTPLAQLDAEAIAALPPPPAPEPPPFDDAMLERIAAVQPIVDAAAAAHGVDPNLINAVIWVESKFDRRARGPAGAQGLMQLMPKTAAGLAKQLERKRDSWDPDFNIHAGTLLLSHLLRRFDGDLSLALAGYNRGGGTVAKWVAAGEPLPEGAQGFVSRVLRAKAWFEQLP